MGINGSGEYNDTLDNAIWTTIAVTTSAVEAKVGVSRLSGREGVRIHNDSNNTVYFGYSSSVTSSGPNKGEPLLKGESIDIGLSENHGVWLISASGSNNCIVTEFS